jgi:gliding motility-associated-like protein
MSSVGGSKIWIEPLPNINVAAPLTTWVSRIDSGCEGPRTIVTINVHPKPAPPVVAPEYYCQFKFSSPISFTLSNPGDVPTFYGPGVTAGYPFTPTPPTSFAPDTLRYYITETTSHGCISDSVRKDVIIRLKPQPPTVTNVRYCQYELGIRPLNEVVDSDFSSFLNWYDNFANAITVPTPNTFTAPGTTTWWVGQTAPAVNGCASDSVPVRATIIYKPKFSIEVSKDWVCQFDSIVLAYKTAGVSLNIPTYQWTIPFGTEAVNKTTLVDSMITVRFDSAGKYNYVKLRASNENGMCYSDTTVTIRVIPKPTMIAYTKPDVCLGDTVDLALSVRSDNAYEYQWWVDYDTLDNAHALSIISGNSHSSGPYTISWLDTGRHVIKVTSNTIEGCKSDPTYDSVLVHNVPDATFRISSPNGSNICLEDSVQFTANEIDYRNSYYWTPEHDFFNNNHNKPVIWGKMLEPKGLITLKVTDPFGCYATKSMEINPDACCTIAFPNAFAPSPGGEAENNVFKPYFVGYHRFHIFRIVNRWGQTVFESHNSSVMGWDGTYDGVPQDMGVYYYFLRYDCGGKTLEAKGDVTLIR